MHLFVLEYETMENLAEVILGKYLGTVPVPNKISATFS